MEVYLLHYEWKTLLDSRKSTRVFQTLKQAQSALKQLVKEEKEDYLSIYYSKNGNPLPTYTARETDKGFAFWEVNGFDNFHVHIWVEVAPMVVEKNIPSAALA